MVGRQSTNELEVFMEELDENMIFLQEHLEDLEDITLAASLCEQYEDGTTLTSKQLYAAMNLWREAKNNSGE